VTSATSCDDIRIVLLHGQNRLLPELSRKSRLFLEWNWAMFFPPDISHLGYRRTRRAAPVAPVNASRAANG
jgi:hypothetical protein